MNNAFISIGCAVRDAETNEKIGEIIDSLDGFEIQDSKNPPPDLLIYEPGQDWEKEFQKLGSFLKTTNSPDIILTSKNTDSKILLEALRIGVKEFIPQPLDEEEVLKALERYRSKKIAYSQPVSSKTGKIAYVVGCKGGVGATTLAVNLAAALAWKKDNLSVLLIDLNVLYGDIPIFLDIKPSYHWGEAAANIDRLDDVFFTNLLTPHSSGIQVLSSPGMLNGHGRFTTDSMMRLLDFVKMQFDFVVIDGGHSMDDSVLKAIQVSEYLLLVAELNLGCMANTNKLIKFFSQMNVADSNQIKLLINRHTKKSEITLDDVKKSVNKEPFWVIPNDYKTVNATIYKGRSLTQLAPKAAVTKSIRKLAGSLFPEVQKEKRRGFFGKILGK